MNPSHATHSFYAFVLSISISTTCASYEQSMACEAVRLEDLSSKGYEFPESILLFTPHCLALFELFCLCFS